MFIERLGVDFMKLLDFFFVVLRRNSGILGGKEIDMVENLDGEGFGNGN